MIAAPSRKLRRVTASRADWAFFCALVAVASIWSARRPIRDPTKGMSAASDNPSDV